MTSKIFKKIMAVVCASAVLATSIASPVKTDAASKNAKAKKAYEKYLKTVISGGKNCSWFTYNFYDFNKDGIDEFVVCIAGGARPQYDIYTYKNNKVVNVISGENRIGYLKGKKYIVGYGSGGVDGSGYTVYKMKSSGLGKSVNDYWSKNGECTLNGKKIKKSAYEKFEKSVKWNLGKNYKLTSLIKKKKYYSPKQLGIDILGGNGKFIQIVKVKNNKIYYYNHRTSDGDIVWRSKTKTAKITKNTKLYMGNKKLAWSGNLPGDTIEDQKWIYKVTKKQFAKKLVGYKDYADYIKVKNGKVVKAAINLQLAD